MKKKLLIAFIVLLGLIFIFQALHFTEHGIQLGAWFGGFRNMPYMTPWAIDLTWWLGEWTVPGEKDYHRIFKVGVELLHLIGNSIFFVGTFGLHFLLRNRTSYWANIFQGIHVFEHIMLFCTQYFLHKSIGMSTLFGYYQPYGTDVFDRVAMSTTRVWWHFIANLIPSVLVAIALIGAYKAWKSNTLTFTKWKL